MGSHQIEPFEVVSEVVMCLGSLAGAYAGPLLPAALDLEGPLPPLAHQGPGFSPHSHLPSSFSPFKST